jgi:hypothetical protein
MTKTTTRRAFFSTTAAAAVGSVAIVSGLATAAMPEAPAACAAVPADDAALTLWANRQAAVERLRVSQDFYREASAKLPVWAQDGPRMIDHNGNPSAPRLVRPSPADLREHFDHKVRTFGLKGKARRRARDYMNREVAAINTRVAARKRLYDQLGMTASDREGNAICGEIIAAENALCESADNSPNAQAARLLIAVCDNCGQGDHAEGQGYCGTMALALVALTPLIPDLSGLIRDHAALFVANPTLPLGNMPFAPV